MSRLLRLPVILYRYNYKPESQVLSDQKWLDITFFPAISAILPLLVLGVIVYLFWNAMGTELYYQGYKKDIADMWANKLITYIQESFFPKHYYTTLK